MLRSNNARKPQNRLADRKIFQKIFDEYYHPLCFYASRFLQDDARIKDVVQEAFLGCWDKELVFMNRLALRSYLYASVYHSCMDVIKLDNIHRRHHDIIRGKSSDVDRDYLTSRIETEALTQIFKAIDELPAQCGRIFRLSYIENKSVDFIAQELNISPNTVKTQRARAKKLLKDKLKDLYPLMAFLFFS